MKSPMLYNLLILLGYSVLFFGIAGVDNDFGIGGHWATIVVHAVVLMVVGVARFMKSNAQRTAWQWILASILVATIGHGLCFANGLAHFNTH